MIKIIQIYKEKKLYNEVNLFKYGYFYFGYKEKFYFWEFIIQFRKISLIIVNMIFTSFIKINSTAQMIVYIIMISLFWFSNIIYLPYIQELAMILKIENVSFYCLLLNFYIILLALPHKENLIRDDIKGIFTIIAYFFNFVFLIQWGRLFLINDFLKKLKDIGEYILKITKKINKVAVINQNSSKKHKKKIKKQKSIFNLKKNSLNKTIDEGLNEAKSLINKIKKIKKKCN